MAVRDVVQAAAGVGGDKLYVEDVFSTYLYQGNTSTQTFTNGIDLAGEGGLVWIKCRTTAFNNTLFDTERGATKQLFSDSTSSESTEATSLTSFNADGFTVGGHSNTNLSPRNYASWTFRKAPKFFDVVTWTGDGTTGRAIPHSLGSTPGCIIIKRTDSASSWRTYHRSMDATNPWNYYMYLDTTQAATNVPLTTVVTSTDFTVPYDNGTGRTFVAYLFAHDAGGFGDDGLQNVISCGNFGVSSSSDGVVNLGWEPQFVIIKQATIGGSGNWYMFDNMRGIVTGDSDSYLYSNSSAAEASGNIIELSATGFTIKSGTVQGGSNYIYIAIRRPMKTPESGTEVFATDIGNSSGAPEYYSGFPVDMSITGYRTGGVSWYPSLGSRLIQGYYLQTANTNIQDPSGQFKYDYMNGFYNGSQGSTLVSWMFRRAPGFFDVVAYTGTGTVGRTVAHNLGVAPELSIIKTRSLAGENWNVWHKDLGIQSPGNYYYLQLNQTNAKQASNDRVSVVSSTTITMGDNGEVNASGATYIAYLFASCPGVSKVGSYTGTGSDINIDCGFSNGARFVLIKNTSAAYNWMLLDTARGITSAGDFYSFLNSTNAEGYGDYIDPYAPGFTVTGTWAAFNQAGDNYIFLAIA